MSREYEKHWRVLTTAIKGLMEDYKSQNLPTELTGGTREKTLQACMFYELLKIGFRDLRLQGAFVADSGKTKMPDMILGNNVIICELKSHFSINPMRKDIGWVEEYGKESLGVFLANGSNAIEKRHLQDYESSLESLGYRKSPDWEILPEQGRHYFTQDYGILYDGKEYKNRRIYLALRREEP